MPLKLVSALIALISMLSFPAWAEQTLRIGDDGLYKQPWFFQSSGNLASDLKTARAEGKDLVVLYEQRGCIYCKKLHEVVFEKPEVVELIKQSFLVVQMDLWGNEQVTDLDGDILSQENLAVKWGVNATPTTIVLSSDRPGAGGLQFAEAFRLPGYLEPFYYFTALDYMASGAIDKMRFKTFLEDRRKAFADKGINPETW